MNKHFISVNGEKRTGEMSVFEAVEALADFKALAEENDKIEIHSLPDKWAIKQNGKIIEDLFLIRKKKPTPNFGF